MQPELPVPIFENALQVDSLFGEEELVLTGSESHLCR